MFPSLMTTLVTLGWPSFAPRTKCSRPTKLLQPGQRLNIAPQSKSSVLITEESTPATNFQNSYKKKVPCMASPLMTPHNTMAPA